jgi:integrase/recombinase XerD
MAPSKRSLRHVLSLANRKVSPHTLRHTTAMHLLQAGVDLGSIALWLGLVSPRTTHTYVDADLAMKERTLEKLAPPSTRSHRFRADDKVLVFLSNYESADQTLG